MPDEINPQLLADIEALANLFREGGWSELRVSSNGLSLLLSKDEGASLELGARPISTSAKLKSPEVTNAVAALPQSVANPVESQPTSVDPSWHAVAAPNLGTFYRSPKPGSPPFVELGQQVAADTEICLLEVMKLFTSVNAGVAGTIMKVCAADAELVEGDQVLFYIQQD